MSSRIINFIKKFMIYTTTKKDLKAIKNLVKQSKAIQNLINNLQESNSEQKKISDDLKTILEQIENSIDSLLKQAEDNVK